MGLAYSKLPANAAQATQIAQASGGKISWMYDWEGYTDLGSGQSNECSVPGVEFVPALHDWTGTFTGPWSSASKGNQGQGAKHAIFVNEPDLNGQQAGAMATLFKNTFAPGAPGAILSGPAVTRGTGPKWLPDFYSACSGCEIGFQPFHYYIPTDDYDTELPKMVTEINQISQIAGGKPVWVTEFGLNPPGEGTSFTTAQYAEAVNKMAAALDNIAIVERYSPFQVTTSGGADAMTMDNSAGSMMSQYLSH